MAYVPKFTRTDLGGGKNILASEHLQYIHGGATLDATMFEVGYNEVGQIIARNEATGKFEPFTAVEGFDYFAVLDEDFRNDGENDLVAGQVIIRGSVYEEKLAQEVPQEFKDANTNIFYVKHI